MENKRNNTAVRYWKEYTYHDLGAVQYHYDYKKREVSANLIICADTETSKEKISTEPVENYVVAWSVCVFNYVIGKKCVYYGHRPDTIVIFLDQLKCDIDAGIIVYFHNTNYDYTFLRQFMYQKWAYPDYQLAVKPHKPIMIRFSDDRITLKDSLILAQRSLERWANDLNVEHKKAVGSWDYNKIRSQHETFTDAELLYISNDVLAQAECLDKMRTMLGLSAVCDMPLTSTSIIRNEARKRSRGEKRNGRMKWFFKYKQIAPPLPVYLMLERAYHGGFTHANRYTIGDVFHNVTGFDFASSYPYTMMAEKFPMDKFEPFPDATPERILKLKDDFAFVFDLLIYDFELKPGMEMPYLQRSKITKWSDDYVIDNGRVISGTIAQITYTEIDLELFCSTYDFKMIAVKNCYMSAKAYLPEWLRKYIYELFVNKTRLKGVDAVLYALAKSQLNGVYGMTVEKQIRPEFMEDYTTGEYNVVFPDDPGEALQKKYNNKNSFLPYQIGCWVCAFAVKNLFRLGSCCKLWLYSDTDSVKGIGWDMEAVERYNQECKDKLMEAGIFEPVQHNGKEYWLGVAEFDGDYSEFVSLGSKRYAVREDGKLKITVAGVPKAGAACLHDNIYEFQGGKIFDGKTSGKKQLTYFFEPVKVKNGVLYGDSIDLTECDYLLSSTEKYNGFWEVYEDELPLDFQ